MRDIFSVEETNLMCIYGTNDRTTLITELKNGLPGVSDPEMREVYNSAIGKLQNISDDDFAGIGFYTADEYTEGTEG